MIDNENRKLAAIALGRALIAAAGTHPLPERPDEREREADLVSGEWLGRSIVLGLLAGGRAEGFNLYEVMTGLGQAVGEMLGGEYRLMLEVYVEKLDRGVAHGAGLEFKERPC